MRKDGQHLYYLTKKQLNVLRSVAGKDKDRPHLHQVFFDVEQGYAASTDGYRMIVLAAATVDLGGRESTFGVATAIVRRVADSLAGDDEACFTLHEGKVLISTTGGLSLSHDPYDKEFPRLDRVATPYRDDDEVGPASFGIDPAYLTTLTKIADALVTRPHKQDNWKPMARCSVPGDKWSPFRYDVEDPDSEGPVRWTYWVMPMRLR